MYTLWVQQGITALMTTFWQDFGKILATFWLHFGNLRLHSGYILAIFWLHFVYILATFWLHFGYINNCWRSVPLPCGQYMAIFVIIIIIIVKKEDKEGRRLPCLGGEGSWWQQPGTRQPQTGGRVTWRQLLMQIQNTTYNMKSNFFAITKYKFRTTNNIASKWSAD